MRYLVLVSHGELAKGMSHALEMLAGKRSDLIAVGLKDGTDQFSNDLIEALAEVGENDELIVVGDLIGGSPLTTATNIISQSGRDSVIIGGMNLPLALTVLVMKDALSTLQDVVEEGLKEGRKAVEQFIIETSDDEDDDI